MPRTVTSFAINYDAINENNAFSSGDCFSGRLILEVSKKVKINSLSVKCKGEADVYWTESDGDDNDSYSAREKYFKLKQYIISEKKNNEDCDVLLTQGDKAYSRVVGPGVHVYPFSFQIPKGNFPSSFQGVHGKILYSLEAKLSRSMRLPSTAKTELKIFSNPDMNINPLKEPLSQATQKKLKLFTSGTVSMNIGIEKAVYMQGEVLKISADVENRCSRAVKPKFAFEQMQSFFASGSSKIITKVIVKEIGECVASSARSRITAELKIPPDVSVTILDCSIIKVEYMLKAYLDVPYAVDPEIKIPLVILPATYDFGPLTVPNIPIGFQLFGNYNPGLNSQIPLVFPNIYVPQTHPDTH